jgi:hypothetical protein
MSSEHARLTRPAESLTALVLQGGGALGAYQGGAFEALAARVDRPTGWPGSRSAPSTPRSSPATRPSAASSACASSGSASRPACRRRPGPAWMARSGPGPTTGRRSVARPLACRRSFSTGRPHPGGPTPRTDRACTTPARCARPCSNWSISTSSIAGRPACRWAPWTSKRATSPTSTTASSASAPSTSWPAARCRRAFRR